MKKRIVLLTTLAAMLAAAIAFSGVAQGAPTIGTKADAKCLAEAAKTLQPGFNPSNYTFHGGTELADNFTDQATDGVPEVFCGFGSGSERERDVISVLSKGDIFLGGAGIDDVDFNEGTFYGQEGGDVINTNFGGTFFGGEGNDFVNINEGTFHGEAGDDVVNSNFGTFDGGDGVDTVFLRHPGDNVINVEEGV